MLAHSTAPVPSTPAALRRPLRRQSPGDNNNEASQRPVTSAFLISIPESTRAERARAGRMNYWLMKSEPDECSIDDALAAPKRTVPWTGVRNYQARNFMRDRMKPGDGVLFYHSSCAEPGIAGLAEVASTPYPDPTQFERRSKYYDAASRREVPRWVLVDIRARRKTRLISLAELRAHPKLADMAVLRRGNRLSITPVTADEWTFIRDVLLKDRR
jgi:predicted RNA-binding protein with PUA-like domain